MSTVTSASERADALVGELVAAADALAGRDYRRDSQLRTRLFPGEALAGIPLDLDLAPTASRFAGPREGRCHFLEEQVESIHDARLGSSADAAAVVLPPDRLISDIYCRDLYLIPSIAAEGFSRDNRDNRPRPGSQVL